MSLSREKVAEEITNEVQNLAGKPLPGLDAELFTSGYLDSLNILHIIFFLESQYHLKVDPFSVNLEILGTVNHIVNFVFKSLKL